MCTLHNITKRKDERETYIRKREEIIHKIKGRYTSTSNR